jgi:hypothetical protein
MGCIAFGKPDFGRYNVVEADGGSAVGAYKVNVVVVVMAFRAVLAKGIANGGVRSRDGMHDAFFHEGLQGPVNGYAVEFFTGFLFDVAMCQGVLAAEEQGQYFFAAVRYAQVLSAQYIV